MSVESTELVLFIDNDEPTYRQKNAIFLALARKKERNAYSATLAPKAFASLVNNAARKYVREHGSPGDRWNLVFSPIHRRQTAVLLTEHFQNWYDVDYPTLKKPARQRAQ